MAIEMTAKYSLRFQAELGEYGQADVIVKDDVTLPEAIDILNGRGIECFVLGGRGLNNRISVGGGHLRRLGWYQTEEYADLIRQGKVVTYE